MNATEKTNAAIKYDVTQNIASVCYICGNRHDADKELCPACVRIISVGLKLFCIDKPVHCERD